MDVSISRAEHEEFCRRMESENHRLADENNRQNHRLDVLEEAMKNNSAMVANVERLAVNMENMLKVQEAQGKRLDTLEQEPGRQYKTVKAAVITSVISTLTGGVLGAVMALFIK